jgi:uncharacterized membrane protein YeaQ/YmgE (transglycosylase-associated protein family)
MLTVILGFIVIGLVIGVLGRLVAPGPNPIGIAGTIVAGLLGAIVGGLVTTALIGVGHPWIALLVEVAIAAVFVSLLSRSRYGARRI